MSRQLAVLVPPGGVRLLTIDSALLAELEASGQVKFVRIEDQRRPDDQAGGIVDPGEETRLEDLHVPAPHRGYRYAAAPLRPSGYKPTAADFRTVLDAKLADAHQRGETAVVIRAGNLHHEVGGYPSTHHRMPVCCSVMRERMQDGDQIKFQPPSGVGASLEVEFRLPR